MKFLLTLLLIFICSFLTKWTRSKRMYFMIDKLCTLFDQWLDSGGATTRPSNAEFEYLYEDKMKTNEYIIHDGPLINPNKFDVIYNFPSADNLLIPYEKQILKNLNDYYFMLYNETFTLAYWIDFMIFLPRQLVNYLEIKGAYLLSKVLTVCYWIITVLFLTWRPFLKDFIDLLLSK